MGERAPHTLHGWYALHQVFRIDAARANRLDADARSAVASDVGRRLAPDGDDGWSAVYELIGGSADLLFVHFRPTMDALALVARALRRSAAGELLRLEYDFVSIAEAALYPATAEAEREAAGRPGVFRERIDELAAAEAGAPRMRQRLQPPPPSDWRYVCFYPMTRRRAAGENWYTLPLDERDRMLRDHGLTGRRFAGRIAQIITGATGLSAWEWGVTLFANDPLDFKQIVTDMRFDEASARYAEFGPSYTGVRAATDWL